MPSCAAYKCTNRSEYGFSMRIFPKDPVRRAVWIAQVNRPTWKPANTSHLCEIHFTEDQWEKVRVDGKRKLKISAVPTLFEHNQSPGPPRTLPGPLSTSPGPPRTLPGPLSTSPGPPRTSPKEENERNLPNRCQMTMSQAVMSMREHSYVAARFCEAVLGGKNIDKKKTLQKHQAVHNAQILQNAQQTLHKVQQTKHKYQTVHKAQLLQNAQIFQKDQTLHNAQTLHKYQTLQKEQTFQNAQTLHKDQTLQKEQTFQNAQTLHKNQTLQKDHTLHNAQTLQKEQTFQNAQTLHKDQTLQKDHTLHNAHTIHNIIIKEEPQTVPADLLEENVSRNEKVGHSFQTTNVQVLAMQKQQFGLVKENIAMKARIEKLENELIRRAVIIRTQRRKIKMHVNAKYKNKGLVGPFAKNLGKFLTVNQIQSLAVRSTKGFAWSTETVENAMRLKRSCKKSGYVELLRQGYPIPSLRTIRRRQIPVEKSVAETIEAVVNLSGIEEQISHNSESAEQT